MSFTTVDQAGLSAFVTFRNEVAAPRPATRMGKRDVIVFVHGYNENFQEALFRLAGMSADAQIDATPILFSWPSLGALSGYVADKDSVTYSRDYLVQTLTMLASDPRIGKITVLGHSMGGWLDRRSIEAAAIDPSGSRAGSIGSHIGGAGYRYRCIPFADSR